MAKTFTTGEVLTASDVNVNLATLMPMIPTSVSGSGVTFNTTTGLVTCTTSTSASLNGVFTSTYSRYVIHYDMPTTSGNLTLRARLRASGTDNSDAVYYIQRNVSRGSDVSAPASLNTLASTFFILGSVGTRLHFGDLELGRPATATPTLAIGKSFVTLNPATAADTTALILAGGLHRSSTAFDGISILASANNFTGTIKVYAYN